MLPYKAKPVEITVKPLPVENKPEDFKGAVGNFTIQASFQKNKITTDDAGNLKIVIRRYRKYSINKCT